MRKDSHDAGRPIPDGAKRCRNKACLKVKPASAFSKCRRERDGLQRYCKACRRGLDVQYRKTQMYRDARAELLRDDQYRREQRDRARAYSRTETFKAIVKRYRSSERGKLMAALGRARYIAGHDPSERAREFASKRAEMYAGCLAALDPEDGRPAPDGCRRCPRCYTPKPEQGGFYTDVREPSGRSKLCRDCEPGGSPGRVEANAAQRMNTKRQKVLSTLRSARRRLETTRPANRARILKTIEICERELRRDCG